MAVRPEVSGNTSRNGPLEIAESAVITVLAAASAWALGSAYLEPAVAAIAVLAPLALVITWRNTARA